jgi:Tfp pilus assembly protein PilE
VDGTLAHRARDIPESPQSAESPHLTGGPAKLSAFRHGDYNITVATPTPATYTLTATPVAGPMANDLCGNLLLDSTGLRTISTAADINLCWGR